MQNQIGGGNFTGPELGKIITQLGPNIPVAWINRNMNGAWVWAGAAAGPGNGWTPRGEEGEGGDS